MADFAVVKQATIKRKQWQSDFDAAAEESRAGGGEVRNQNEHQPHAKGSRRSTMPRQIKADGKTLSCTCGARLESLPGCMARAVVRLRASATETSGTARGPRKQWRFGS